MQLQRRLRLLPPRLPVPELQQPQFALGLAKQSAWAAENALLARIIHQDAIGRREAESGDTSFRGVGTRVLGFEVAPKVCVGASGPVAYGGCLAMRAARSAKPAW